MLSLARMKTSTFLKRGLAAGKDLLRVHVRAGRGQPIPDCVEPCLVFRLHEHRAQAGDKVFIRHGYVSPGRRERVQRQLYKSQVQAARGAGVKGSLRQMGSLFRMGGLELPHNNVELWPAIGEGFKTSVGAEAAIEIESGSAALRQSPSELPFGHRRQQLLRGPQSHGRCAGARALQADFAQMKLL